MAYRTWALAILVAGVAVGHRGQVLPGPLVSYPHLKYAGYYFADSAEYGRHAGDTYAYTNLATITGEDVSTAAAARAAAWRRKGVEVILDVSSFFFEPADSAGCWRRQASPRWYDSGISIAEQVVRSGDVYAFYIMDEPQDHCLSRTELETVIGIVKASFPSVPTMITEHALVRPPSNVDVYSLSCYTGDSGVTGPADCMKRYEYVRRTWDPSPPRWLLTVESFDGFSSQVMDPAWQASWYATAGQYTYLEGILWFLYPDVPGQYDGTMAYPLVRDYQTEVGRTILCANESEYRPTLGADGNWYRNPNEAKCVSQGVLESWSCARSTDALQYYPLARPCRVFDSRSTGGGPLGSDEDLNIQLALDSCGIPKGIAEAVAVEVAAVGPTAQGNLALRCGPSLPGTTVLDYPGGIAARASNAIVSVSPYGHAVATAHLANHAATTHLVVDATGFFASGRPHGQEFTPLPVPWRIVDTRLGSATPLAAGVQQAFKAQGFGAIPRAGVSALALSAIVVDPPAGGHLLLYRGGLAGPPSSVSHLNYVAGQTIANGGVVTLGPPDLDLAAWSTQSHHLVVDATGYFSAPGGGTLTYHAIAPCRAADATLAANAERTIAVRGVCGIPSGADAIAGHFVAVGPAEAGRLNVYPGGIGALGTSLINYEAGSPATGNGAIVRLGVFPGDLKALSTASVRLLVDVTGYFMP